MAEQDPLETLAAKYRNDGYDVIVHPQVSDLPVFLRDSDFDILARQGEHFVAVQMKDRDSSNPEEEHLRVAAGFDDSSGTTLIDEAEMLLTPSTMRAALVMAWAAFEAAARDLLRGREKDVERFTPRQLIQKLRADNYITEKESDKLLEGLHLRTMVVHGIRPEEIPSDSVAFLLNLARKFQAVASGDGVRVKGGSVSFLIHRAGINKSPELKTLVDEATKTLSEVLGPSTGLVSVEWAKAEDAKGRPVIVLKLADFAGVVVATFDPEEMKDKLHMASRLNRLWAELLQIRSHKQLQRLVGSVEE